MHQAAATKRPEQNASTPALFDQILDGHALGQGFGRYTNSVDLRKGFLQTDLTPSGNDKSGELSAARDSDALARACALYEFR